MWKFYWKRKIEIEIVVKTTSIKNAVPDHRIYHRKILKKRKRKVNLTTCLLKQIKNEINHTLNGIKVGLMMMTTIWERVFRINVSLSASNLFLSR